MTMTTRILICRTSRLQRLASAHFSSTNSALVKFAQAEGDLMRNVLSLHPVSNQTGVILWQLSQYILQGVLTVLRPQVTVQLTVTQRAREARNDQRETARRAVLHQRGEFLAGTHHCEAAARQNLVSIINRNGEAHTYLMCR